MGRGVCSVFTCGAHKRQRYKNGKSQDLRCDVRSADLNTNDNLHSVAPAAAVSHVTLPY